MTTESSPRFLSPKNVSLLVALLFIAGLVIAFALWPEPAAAPGTAPEVAEISAEAPATPPSDWTDRSDSAKSDAGASGSETGAPASGDFLRVVGTVPVKHETLGNRIVVFFSEPVAAAGLDGEGATPPFTMTPPFQGTFAVAGNYLDIRSDDFPPDQIVTLELGDAIQSKDGKTVDPQDRRLTFAPFTFEAQRVWSLESTDDREVLGVVFPVPVTVEMLRDHTKIQTADGQPVPFAIEEGTSNTIQRLAIEGNTSWPVSIQFSAGLQDATGDLALSDAQEFTYPTELELAIQKVTWNRIEDGEQQIAIQFSKAVDSTDLEKNLTITDADSGSPITFSVEPLMQGPNQIVVVHLAKPTETSLLLDFASGLSGAERSELTQPVKRKLIARSLQEREPLRFENEWWSQEGREGLVLNLGFNQKVEPQDLKAHLKTSRDIPDLRIEPAWNNQRVRIFGQWQSETTYEFTLTAGMPYGDGFKLDQDFSRTITTDKVPPYLGFGQEDKYYFPRRSGLDLPIAARGVRKVRVNLYRMFPSNIAVAVRDMNDGKPWYQYMDSWCESLTKNERDVAFSAGPNDAESDFLRFAHAVGQTRRLLFAGGRHFAHESRRRRGRG